MSSVGREFLFEVKAINERYKRWRHFRHFLPLKISDEIGYIPHPYNLEKAEKMSYFSTKIFFRRYHVVYVVLYVIDPKSDPDGRMSYM